MIVRTLLLFTALTTNCLVASAANDCSDLLNHEVRKLRSDETVNLCDAYRGKALLIVNTASSCGFTPQFKGLEALYQEYKDQGLAVLGFPSDDFNQEADNEEDTAKVCYVNYGVTFDMYATAPVRGDDAQPIFKQLNAAKGAPKWNFYKYVIDRQGNVIDSFASMTSPDSKKLRTSIEQALINAD